MAGRPVDFQSRNLRRVTESDMLLQRICAPAAARRDMSVDRQGMVAGCDELDPGADGRSVRLLTHQFDRQPVMTLARILEQDVVILVTRRGSSHLDEDIQIAVAVPVCAGDAMPFLEVTRSG